jgi:phosphoglycerol transferase MdoB-like AlkP superfamily enzyme
MAKKTDLFNKHKDVYNHWEQDKMKEKPAATRKKNQVEMGIHDKSFFPSAPPKTGALDKSIGKFPIYMENPLKFTTRKVPEEDAPPPFKQTHKGYTRPSPSVQTNLRNLKASFPSVFRR